MPAEKPLRFLLSLDGGGSHLLIQLSVLACLEQDTGISTYERFDMIAGSSSGGLIACLILGQKTSAEALVHKIVKERLLQAMMIEHGMSRFLSKLQLRPKFQSESKRKVLQAALQDCKLSSLEKPLFIPCFNLSRDFLEVFTNSARTDFWLHEIADACTAAPSFYAPVRLQDGDWRIDGGVGMNNPGLSAYLYAQRYWPNTGIRMLSIGSGWRRFTMDGLKACRYGGLQWSASGIASLILREKMISNANNTELVLGDQMLYINDYLQDYNMPDYMDSAKDPAIQQKALAIGGVWYRRNQAQIKQWLNNPG
ncbi:patatin-like phospholipase family protein [Nitrosomonas sp.]|uniref:patatin-like phospholipase family protein n=1 Tax=Nitrosomonas sp. TaxID=42353 RepID=UPI001DD8D65C|nr:patatin-like phospholipase family protein [Nitrosomonas sp.]MBX3617995.1 patatin-like phospholipase family protein [Nitrosomonas sp.]